MQGRQDYQPKLFTTINLEELIPKNHLLRRLDAALNLGFVREATKDLYCANNGRPSIDPELFFRMVLVEYFYNVDSDRQLCEEIGYNLAYRWFCRLSLEDDVPEHSSLTRIRDRLGEAMFKKLFLHVIEVCQQKGLVKANKVVTDGSWVKANAALNSLTEKDPKPEASKDDGDNNPKPGSSSKSIKGKRFSNATHVSTTDPEATLAGKENEPKGLKYKVHSTADAESRVILDCHVTTGAVPDCTVYTKRIEEIEKALGCKIAQASADRGYGTGEILQFLKDKGVESFIPRFHKDTGEKCDREKTPYDVASDEFRCELGNCLSRCGQHSDGQIVYRPKLGSCTNCERKSWCVIKRRGLRISPYHQVHYETQLKEQTPEFRKKMGERQWKIEGLWAEGKENHGLDRAKYRGRAKMQIQAYLTSTVQNLKRLMAVISPGPGTRNLISKLQAILCAAIAKLFRKPLPV